MLKLEKENLQSAFSASDRWEFDTLQHDNYDYDKTCQEVIGGIKVKAWRILIAKLEIRKFLSIKRAEQLDKMLTNPDALPPVTVQDIYAMFETLIQNSNDFVKEAVKEVYDWLHPNFNHSDYGAAKYKTNQKNAKFELGKKIIVTSIIENTYGGGFRVSYYNDKYLIALDKVFHALDGKGMLDGYKSPLIDAINTCNGEGETNYFKFHCYSNGNLHIEFRRLDLLSQVNAMCGNPTELRA